MATQICVITNAYPDFESSYHGIFIRRTVEDMAGRGYFSHVLVPRIYKHSLAYEEHPTHTVTRFRFPSAQKLLIEYEGTPFFRLGLLVANGVLAAVGAIRGRGCALVHAHWAIPSGLIGLAAARLTGKPLVVTVHGSDWRLAESRGGPSALAFRLAVRGAARVISVSGTIAASLAQRGVRPGAIVTCPMGVDQRIFSLEKTKPDPALSGRFNMIITRNLLPLYRVGDLLEAAARVKETLPGLRIIVAGEGPERERLEHLRSSLGLGPEEVVFFGRVDQDRLASLLASSGIYVSTSPAEGTSVSLLEAMALGVLPVAADIPANREWISHGVNGLLFQAGDVDSLAEALVRAAGDEELRARARSEGPSIVAVRGSWAAQIDKLEETYHGLLSGHCVSG